MIARHAQDESVIADYCGPAHDTGVMLDLAYGVLRDLISRGTTRVRCETTHEPLAGVLTHAGFVRSRHASRFRVHTVHDVADPLAGWLLMPGDSDGDVV